MKKSILLFSVISILCAAHIQGQTKKEYQLIEKKTSIWQGSIGLEQEEVFFLTNQNGELGITSDNGRSLQFDVQYIRMISGFFGAGLKTSGTIFGIGGGGATGIALGPVIRTTLFQQPSVLVYSEGFYQYAHDLNIGLIGQTTGFGSKRYRTGLVLGSSVRVSNRAGIFLRFQHIWERDKQDDFFSGDTRNRALLVGIELFTFK